MQFCLTTEITKTGTPYQHICPVRTESAPLFLELGILTVFKVFMMKVAVVILKSFHGFSIEPMSYFIDVQNVHAWNVSKLCKNHVQFSRREMARKLYKYKAVNFRIFLTFSILTVKYVKSYLMNIGGLDILNTYLLQICDLYNELRLWADGWNK